MTESVLDMSALKRLMAAVGGDFGDLVELRDDYMATAPSLLAKIQEAGDAGDFDALRIQTHSLKSNARDFGALQLAELCASLEQQCREGHVADVQSAISEIESAEAVARAALAKIGADDVADG